MQTINIRQDIGEGGISEHAFAAAVESLDPADELRLIINSFGGSVFAALSMVATLSRFQGPKIAEVEGIAASAATFLAMACDEIAMHEASFFMVHRSHGATIGNHADMEAQARTLKQIDDQIAGIYAARSGGSKADWLTAMSLESWFTAAEMSDMGLATVIPSKRPNTSPHAAKAERAIANRSVRAAAIVDRLAGPRFDNPYAARVEAIRRDLAADARRDARRKILENATSPSQARKYLNWT